MANRPREHTPEEGFESTDGAVIIPGKPERALKHEFVCKKGGPPEYKFCQGDWAKSVVSCVIDDIPFSEGALRQVYRMQIVAKDGTRHDVVAKVSKDPNEERSTYYRDVQAQMCAREWAAEFNNQSVPKPIDFVPAYVFELVDRPGRPLIGVEEFVEGVFIKHNNNVGGIMTAGGDSERATPNAFSHFTWEASAHTLLVCDIQGVNDRYTDPQIHTASGKGFGRGNLGEAGLKAFLSRHRCTQICEALCLPEGGGSSRDVPPLERKGTPVLRNDSALRFGSGGEGGGGGGELGRHDSQPDLTLQGSAINIPPEISTSVSSALPDTEEVLLAPAPRERSFKPKEEEEAPAAPVPALDKHDDLLMDQILDELSDL